MDFLHEIGTLYGYKRLWEIMKIFFFKENIWILGRDFFFTIFYTVEKQLDKLTLFFDNFDFDSRVSHKNF